MGYWSRPRVLSNSSRNAFGNPLEIIAPRYIRRKHCTYAWPCWIVVATSNYQSYENEPGTGNLFELLASFVRQTCETRTVRYLRSVLWEVLLISPCINGPKWLFNLCRKPQSCYLSSETAIKEETSQFAQRLFRSLTLHGALIVKIPRCFYFFQSWWEINMKPVGLWIR